MKCVTPIHFVVTVFVYGRLHTYICGTGSCAMPFRLYGVGTILRSYTLYGCWQVYVCSIVKAAHGGIQSMVIVLPNVQPIIWTQCGVDYT